MEINRIYNEDCLDTLKRMNDCSIDCCITSPPYFGLRDYQTAKWEGGDVNCNHKHYLGGHGGRSKKQVTNNGTQEYFYTDVCKKCGAVRIDYQVGLEKTPEEYVNKLVEVFREVRRVLKEDGTFWLNLGDSYNGSGKAGKKDSPYFNRHTEFGKPSANKEKIGNPTHIKDLKPKDLIGIPWRVAFALQEDGWWLRQDIIWAKPNPMPESVRDRCTKSHEYIFLLTKSNKYYYDYKAIMEPAVSNNPRKEPTRGEGYGKAKGIKNNPDRDGGFFNNGFRNKRDVWVVNTKPYKGAHFATFPEALIEPMVLTTRKDAIIYDPFMGAGTTALVSLKLGRSFIGSELNKDYCDLINKRLDIAKG